MSLLTAKILRNNLFVFHLIFCAFSLNAQKEVVMNTNEDTKWYIGLEYGIQMSGIKSEDFITSNYSPVFRASLGKWISDKFAIEFGYQGKYFFAISDEFKYNYDFYFVEGVIDLKNLFYKNRKDWFYNLYLHAGPGYFNHYRYDRRSIHGNLGATNIFSISKKFNLSIDISAIVGWDIYQGDQDILPNLSFGVSYGF